MTAKYKEHSLRARTLLADLIAEERYSFHRGTSQHNIAAATVHAAVHHHAGGKTNEIIVEKTITRIRNKKTTSAEESVNEGQRAGDELVRNHHFSHTLQKRPVSAARENWANYAWDTKRRQRKTLSPTNGFHICTMGRRIPKQHTEDDQNKSRLSVWRINCAKKKRTYVARSAMLTVPRSECKNMLSEWRKDNVVMWTTLSKHLSARNPQMLTSTDRIRFLTTCNT